MKSKMWTRKVLAVVVRFRTLQRYQERNMAISQVSPPRGERRRRSIGSWQSKPLQPKPHSKMKRNVHENRKLVPMREESVGQEWTSGSIGLRPSQILSWRSHLSYRPTPSPPDPHTCTAVAEVEDLRRELEELKQRLTDLEELMERLVGALH